MSNIRKAHSVEIIDKRLRDCEVAGEDCDAMELVGLHDELSRVERKWIDKANDEERQSSNRTRPLANEQQINLRFERLMRLIDAAMRRSATIPELERDYLARIATSLKRRVPLQRK